MPNRRTFLKLSALSSGLILTRCTTATEPPPATTAAPASPAAKHPIVLSTWHHGMPANKAAFEVLAAGGTALDAVEAGVRIPEADPESSSVGYGGRPDREGRVTLDACIQNHDSSCGGVAFLQHIKHPISVARKVMEETPHVLLVGDGALRFALDQGFEKEDLLTEDSRKAWEEWLETNQHNPINWENHDTIGMLAIDANGQMAGACTTSGAAWKIHGRVGDSPIIGAGLFVDGDVGGACATGMGEAMIRTAGSAMVVEQMRNGKSPQEACEIIVNRIIARHKSMEGLQVGFLAMNMQGETGAYCVYKGFNYAQTTASQHDLIDARFDRTWE